MKNKEIITQNKEYFVKYPHRANWLKEIKPPQKGGYWSVEYKEDCIILIEMVKHNTLGIYVVSDRVVYVFDDKFLDSIDF